MDQLTVSTASATGNPRNKVALKPGRSLMDWIKLTNSSADLSGTGNRLRDISPEELSRHNKQDDAWIAIRGFVYNVTSYFEFHPGGEEELMRGVGIDATDLFDQVHKWVNYESMLKKCLVGRLKLESAPAATKRPPSTKPDNGFRLPPPSLPSVGVTVDWMQSLTSVTLVLYTRQKGINSRQVSTFVDGKHLRARVYNENWRSCYDYQILLEEDVEPSCTVTVSSVTGKVELLLRKKQPSIQWPKFGDLKGASEGFQLLNKATSLFRQATITRKNRVNHKVFLFTLTFPPGQNFYVPIGWHVQLKLSLEDGSELIRSYTPIPVDLVTSVTDCPSTAESKASLHFLIKVYPNGPFTSALNRLNEGSSVDVSDPLGNFEESQLDDKNVVTIAAGTGITPMIRPIVATLRSNRKAWLLFFNRTQQDIIWKEEFHQLKIKYPDTFKVWHVLSEPDDEWIGLRGRISESVLTTTIYESIQGYSVNDSNLTCVCGPSEFTFETLRLLESAGCTKHVHAFTG